MSALRAELSSTLTQVAALQKEVQRLGLTSPEASTTRWVLFAVFAFLLGVATRFC